MFPAHVLLFYRHRFNTFHLEASSSCRYDYVAVYDGQDTLAPLLGKFCGAVLPPDLRSSTNQLFIIFRTDASVNGIGWRATYSETLGGSMLLYCDACLQLNSYFHFIGAHGCNKAYTKLKKRLKKLWPPFYGCLVKHRHHFNFDKAWFLFSPFLCLTKGNNNF